MENKEVEIFDKTKEFDEEIKPLIEKIDIKCREKRIPYFFTCAIKNNETGTQYSSNMLSSVKSGRNLENDVIAEGIKVLRGYHAVPSNKFESCQEEIVFNGNAGKSNKNKDADDILEDLMHEVAEVEGMEEESMKEDSSAEQDNWKEPEPLYVDRMDVTE